MSNSTSITNFVDEAALFNTEITFRVGCALSCLGSGAILITAVLFYSSMVKNKIFMKMICMVSICDVFAGKFYV